MSASTITSKSTWSRALAIHMLVFHGCIALGSLLWGAIAQRTGISTALTAATVGLMVSVVLMCCYRLRCSDKLDLSASLHWHQPARSIEPCPNDGPVLVTLEYYIDPENAEEFTKAMQVLSKIRRRDGAIKWGLYQDLSEPGRFVETIVVESWAEHQRQFERVTNSDRVIEDHVRRFHIGDEPPKVSQSR